MFRAFEPGDANAPEHDLAMRTRLRAAANTIGKTLQSWLARFDKRHARRTPHRLAR